MRKLLLTAFLVCLSSSVFAQVKISQMPPGGATAAGDTVPVVRGGVNFQTQFTPVLPAGSTGAVQTNNGAGGFNSFLLGTTSGSGSSAEGLLLNNSGVTQALSIGTVNSLADTVTPLQPAASALYQASEGLLIDPRMYGAQCNATYFRAGDGQPVTYAVTATANSPIISISNYTFKTTDVGKYIAINGGNSSSADLGIGTTTIVSVNLANNTATLAVSPTVSTTSGYAVFGFDDTAAFEAAAADAFNFGGRVLVPDSCLVRNLVIPNGVTLEGPNEAVNYGPYGGRPISKPVLYILSTGYTDDVTAYGINISNSYFVGLKGFSIRSAVFPYTPFPNSNLACVGSANATPSDNIVNENITLDSMSISSCFVAFGTALNDTVQSHISFQSRFNEIVSNGYGYRGNFTDSTSTNDIFTGNFNWAIYLGPQGTAGYPTVALRFVQTRIETQNGGIFCASCTSSQFEGLDFQDDNHPGPEIDLDGTWNDLTFTGGSFEGSGNPGNISMTGFGNYQYPVVTFTGIYATGDQSFLSITATSVNPTVQFLGGISNYTSANFVGANPTSSVYVLRFQPSNQPAFITGAGVTDLTINANHALGLQTTSANQGTILDMSLASTTTNSSVMLPVATSANRPTVPLSGMMRYNSSAQTFEGFTAGAWTPFATTLPYYYAGLTLSNDTITPNSVIDIASGAASSDNGTINIPLPGAYTKSLTTWAVGAGNGCLDSGSVAASTWYHIFLILRTDTLVTDILCSTSITAPVMPAGYTEKRRIGSIETNGSSNIIGFTQVGTTFLWATPTLDVSTTSLGTTAALETLNVPPGVNVTPICRYSISNASPPAAILLSGPGETDIAPTTTTPFSAEPGYSALQITSGAGVANSVCEGLITNTTQQIRARSTAASTSLSIVTRGYID